MEAIKLGTLFLKTVSKPVAKGIKTRIANHPSLTAVTIGIGQWTHQTWSKVTIYAAGHKSLRVKPLDEAAALNQGAEFVSEGFIFGVAAGCVLFEMNRSDAQKARDNAKKKKAEVAKDAATVERFSAIEDRMKRIEESLHLLESRVPTPAVGQSLAPEVRSWRSFRLW